MNFTDEKDYIMRLIKEMVRVLFSLMFGKKYVSVELEAAKKYEVSGRKLDELLELADAGQINEAENFLLCGLDYTNQEEVALAALFYQHLSEMEEEFLAQHQYSKEEVLEGMKELLRKAGHQEVMEIVE